MTQNFQKIMEVVRVSTAALKKDGFSDKQSQTMVKVTVDLISATMDQLDKRFEKIDERFKDVDRRLEKMGDKIDSLQRILVFSVIALATIIVSAAAVF